jgi:hypothetical protein
MSKTHKDTIGKRYQPKSAPHKTRRHYKDGSRARKVYDRNSSEG